MAISVPEIHTERLLLDAFTLDDAPAVYGYAADPEVARFTSWEPHESIADSKRWIRSVVSRQSLEMDEIALAWAIRRVDVAKAIGSIAFTQLDAALGRIDYALSRAAWGNGYATDAALAVMRWGFGQLPLLERIETGCIAENTASTSVMERCGMERFDETRVPVPKFGNAEIDMVHYRVSRAEFELVLANLDVAKLDEA